jgi:hypothetical protein
LPFNEPSLSLADIRDAIAAVEEFTKDMDFDTFREDPKTIAAVERKLQVISEAAIRLGGQRLQPRRVQRLVTRLRFGECFRFEGFLDVSHFFSDAGLSPDRLPSNRPATVKSSSRSGQ